MADSYCFSHCLTDECILWSHLPSKSALGLFDTQLWEEENWRLAPAAAPFQRCVCLSRWGRSRWVSSALEPNQYEDRVGPKTLIHVSWLLIIYKERHSINSPRQARFSSRIKNTSREVAWIAPIIAQTQNSFTLWFEQRASSRIILHLNQINWPNMHRNGHHLHEKKCCPQNLAHDALWALRALPGVPVATPGANHLKTLCFLSGLQSEARYISCVQIFSQFAGGQHTLDLQVLSFCNLTLLFVFHR